MFFGKAQRSFKLLRSKKLIGNYKSNTPGSAARKAGNRLIRKMKKKPSFVLVTVVETTRGSAKKHFRYKVRRIKLKTPVEIGKGKKKRIIRYKTIAKSIKK